MLTNTGSDGADSIDIIDSNIVLLISFIADCDITALQFGHVL